MNNTSFKKLSWVSLFGIAMALLEAAVVVYLRQLYYPEGFEVPLKMLPRFILMVELGRELATIVMLLTVGILTGKDFQERVCYFAYVFGIWDIFYYVWLKLLLDWPLSLLEWDILFLIPLPWVGPVAAPIIVSLCLITGAVIILFLETKGKPVFITKGDWLILVVAALIIVLSFLWDYSMVLNQHFPERYRWEIFLVGLGLGIGRFLWAIRKSAFKN
ncbi:MAG: hypothetical protein ONB05_06130 [candidate division KSB1 bacterium]|nr:hypothetical protein [candidate division KSB1 bacterium]